MRFLSLVLVMMNLFYCSCKCRTLRQLRMLSHVADNMHYMKLALRHAQHAFREKEVPIGAVIVDGNGTVLAAARNQVEKLQDATAHAEIQCLRAAANLRNNWRLHDCTLYTTVEPCAMCMGAIQGFRIKKVVYGAKDVRIGALGSFFDLSSQKHPFHDVEVEGGVLDEDSAILLKRFFQMRRREQASMPPGENVEELIDRGTEN